jgi:CheY-like chemotaxis protein
MCLGFRGGVLSAHGISVLVADDQENMRVLFSKVLQSLGYTCDLAVDGRDCLTRISQKRYDIVFVDLVMPEIDGETILRWLTSHRPGTSVVIVSIQDDDGIIKQLLSLGATAYLVKPFSAHEIQNVMRGVENRRTSAGLSLVGTG